MPRKAKIEAHRGVYQKVKGSDLWWVRWVDVKGQRRTICAGNHSAAVTLADSKQLEKRTAQVLPAIPRRGVKFKEVVEIGVKYSEDAKQGDAKGFKHRAETALTEFGSRAADSITVRSAGCLKSMLIIRSSMKARNEIRRSARAYW